MAFRHGRTRFRRRGVRKMRRTFKKKKFIRKTTRRPRRTRRMHKRGRGSFRSIRNVGNHYERKFLFTLTDVPIDLWNGGTPGNRSLRTDFTIRDLENLTDQTIDGGALTTGVYQAADIAGLCNLFKLARVKRARLFWKTAGDKTDARYNIGNVGNPGFVAANNDADACFTYKRDVQEQPYFDNPTNVIGTGYTSYYLKPEPASQACQNAKLRKHSVWGGSRTFIPSQLREQTIVEQAFDSGTGQYGYGTKNGYYPIYNRFWQTRPPQSAEVGTLSTPLFEDMQYNGITLNFPQVSKMSDYTVAVIPSGAAYNGTGSYKLCVWMEVTIEFKNARSSANAYAYQPSSIMNETNVKRKFPNIKIPDTISEPIKKQVLEEIGKAIPGTGILSRFTREKKDLRDDLK